jgi:type II secretory pathway pseudopilin PulG
MIETLVVIAILVFLAGLVFVVGGPSRESARQAVCVNQLKQLYMAFSLYSADYDHGDEFPELGGLTYVSGIPHEQLAPYGWSNSFRFCPSSSAAMRDNLYSSYAWPVSLNPVNPDGSMSEMRKRMIKRAEQHGTALPIIECHIHDELYYARGEQDVDPNLASPHRHFLQVSGKVFRGRTSGPRTFFFTEMSYGR